MSQYPSGHPVNSLGRIVPREEPVRLLEPRPAVIPVYAKERLQFLASVKIRIFHGNKSIILTFFTEGKEIIPFEDISSGICDEADGAEMVGDEVPDLEGRSRREGNPESSQEW